MRIKVKAAVLAAVFLVAAIGAAHAVVTYGMSLYGDFKYKPDSTHFDYVNPDAPKGGTMRLSSIGTFDTLNPFVIKGVPAAGIGQLFGTLMTRSDGKTSYVFAAAMRDGSTTADFSLAGASGSVEVIGEDRTIPLESGHWQDKFDGYDVHLYRIK